MWSYPRNLPFCYPPPISKLVRETSKKTATKESFWATPAPPPC